MNQSINKSQMIPVLFLGLVAVSFGSIFVKLCDAPSIVIAAYRLTIASVFYISITRVKTGPIWQKYSWSQRKIALISGIFLTIHFAAWITSLKYTSVASSVVLVQSAPIFVAIGSIFFLKEKPSLQIVIGIFITLSGSFIISAHDFLHDRGTLTGNLLAICGAIGAAGYIIAGRKLRANLDTLHYVTAVYSIAALFLFTLALGSGASLIGYSVEVYIFLFASAIVPQMIGHTVFNWALKYFSATTISVTLLGEPIGASILAFFILEENLTMMKILGGVVIILGVSLVLMSESK